MARAVRFRRAFPAVALALIAVAAAPATSAAGEHPLASFKEIREEVQVSDAKPLVFKSLECPKGFVLLHAFWENESEGFINFVIRPAVSFKGIHVANMAVENRSGGTFTVVVGIKCLKAQTGKSKDGDGVRHTHQLQSKFVNREMVIPRGGSIATAVPCPKNFTAVGGAFSGDQTTPREVSTPAEDGDSWRFRVDNFSNQDVTGTFQANCLGDKTSGAKRVSKKDDKPEKHTHRILSKLVEKAVEMASSPQPQQSAVQETGSVSCGDPFFASLLGFDFTGHPFTYLSRFSATSQSKSRRALFPARVGGADFQITNQSTELTAQLDMVCIREKTVKST